MKYWSKINFQTVRKAAREASLFRGFQTLQAVSSQYKAQAGKRQTRLLDTEAPESSERHYRESTCNGHAGEFTFLA